MAILTEIVGFIPDVVSIFKGLEPTPEEQKEKAGTWYKMLQDFVMNDRTPAQLANTWQNLLPLKQRKTKESVINNHILNKSRDYIVNYLVQKINDELIKGGLQPTNRAAVLDGMGAPDLTLSQPAGMSTIGAGVDNNVFAPNESMEDSNESNNFLFVIGFIMLVAGSFVYMFWNPKKRR